MVAADPGMLLIDFPGVPGGGYCASNGLIVCVCRLTGHPGALLMKNVFRQTDCRYAAFFTHSEKLCRTGINK